jgi:sec-independent protein translocase protein TatC
MPRPKTDQEARMTSPTESGTPVWSHRLVWGLLAVAVGTAIGWPIAGAVWDFLSPPPSGGCTAECVRQSTTRPFLSHLKLAFIFGLVVSAPIWLYQLPLPHGVRRRVHLAAALVLFAAGVALASVSLRQGWWMSGSGDTITLITTSTFLDQAIARLLVFGLVMELSLLAAMSLRARRPGARGVPG